MGIIYHLIGKMASVSPDQLTKEQKDELCVSYAALMLHDDGLEINAEKLNKIIKASGNEVEPYWPMLFAKALKGQDVGALLSNIGSAGGAAAGPAAATAGAAAAEAEPEKKERRKKRKMSIWAVSSATMTTTDHFTSHNVL